MAWRTLRRAAVEDMVRKEQLCQDQRRSEVRKEGEMRRCEEVKRMLESHCSRLMEPWKD